MHLDGSPEGDISLEGEGASQLYASNAECEWLISVGDHRVILYCFSQNISCILTNHTLLLFMEDLPPSISWSLNH